MTPLPFALCPLCFVLCALLASTQATLRKNGWFLVAIEITMSRAIAAVEKHDRR